MREWIEKCFVVFMSSPILQGVSFSMVTAVLRVFMDDKETRWQRIFLEALMCGSLTLAASSMLSIWSFPANVAVAIGGGVGFIGSHQVRALLLRFGKAKAGAEL